MSNVYDRQLESQAEHVAIKSTRKPMSNQMINLINYGNAVMQTIAQKEFEALLVETQKQGLIPAFIKNNFDNPDDPSELNEFFSYGKGIVSVPDDFKPIDIPAMVKKEAKNADLDEIDLQKAINKKAMQVLHSLDPNNNAKGYKVEKVVKEIGSGLNDNRPKLQSLLADKSINLILVEHKDRLTRFGFNYIQTLLANSDRVIEVINNLESPKEDLIADFTSVITSFCAKIYGQRRSKRKTEQLIKDLEQGGE